jgi:hypothetical protein
MARTKVTVRGDEAAEAVILRAGRRAGDQSGSLREASTIDAVQKGAWENRTGQLTASLNQTNVESDSLEYGSSVPYSRYVFFGTVHQEARPPKVSEDTLVQSVLRRVANDLVGDV